VEVFRERSEGHDEGLCAIDIPRAGGITSQTAGINRQRIFCTMGGNYGHFLELLGKMSERLCRAGFTDMLLMANHVDARAKAPNIAGIGDST